MENLTYKEAHKLYNWNALPADRISFLFFLLSSIYDNLIYKINSKLCEKFGHNYVEVGYANPESGCSEIYCKRCGESHIHIMY